MGTKVNSNYEDLISFVRASGGGRATALRPVSYGDNELPSASFEVIGTGTWDSLAFVDTVGSQVRPGVTSQTSLTDGTTYALFINITDITGATQVRVDGLDGTDRLLGEGDHRISFASNGGTPRVRLEDTSTSVNDGFTLQNALTAKEVTFDESDGTLTLFEHPENVPRIEYDADGNLLGLLIEEARTNLLTYSEDFTQSFYIKDSNVAVTSSNNTAPSGISNASLITVSDNGRIYANNTSITGVVSVFLKAGTFTNLKIKANNVDLVAKTASAGTLTEVGGGWFRYTSEEATAARHFQIQAYPDDTYSTHTQTGTYYIWGAQLEAGSFPTSYIKTTGSTATRSADVASIPVADFGYNQSAGTVFVEADSKGSDGAKYPRLVDINNGSGNERMAIWLHASDNIPRFKIDDNGVAQANISNGTLSVDVMQKYAADYNANDFAFSVEGNAVSTDTTGTVPTVTTMFIGSNQSGINQLNGHIKSIKYFPRRLTNAQLVDLTS